MSVPARVPRRLAVPAVSGAAVPSPMGCSPGRVLRGPAWIRLLPDVYGTGTDTAPGTTGCGASGVACRWYAVLAGRSAAWLFGVTCSPATRR
ncbi:hypothetical protein V2I01_08790 [Micromonospora sp. BRA006-A]|nr:hypothetical protein [Micromonospora sp. BRA006-A]